MTNKQKFEKLYGACENFFKSIGYDIWKDNNNGVWAYRQNRNWSLGRDSFRNLLKVMDELSSPELPTDLPGQTYLF